MEQFYLLNLPEISSWNQPVLSKDGTVS